MHPEMTVSHEEEKSGIEGCLSSISSWPPEQGRPGLFAWGLTEMEATTLKWFGR
jgi:hypothetical protein